MSTIGLLTGQHEDAVERMAGGMHRHPMSKRRARVRESSDERPVPEETVRRVNETQREVPIMWVAYPAAIEERRAFEVLRRIVRLRHDDVVRPVRSLTQLETLTDMGTGPLVMRLVVGARSKRRRLMKNPGLYGGITGRTSRDEDSGHDGTPARHNLWCLKRRRMSPVIGPAHREVG